MPRTRPAERLDHLADAAATVFAHKGYRALMADVAAEMGVSSGLLYTYVESKEALFHFALTRAVSGATTDGAVPLPIPTPPPGATGQLISAVLRSRLTDRTLRQALTLDAA